jgi:PilZ domain
MVHGVRISSGIESSVGPMLDLIGPWHGLYAFFTAPRMGNGVASGLRLNSHFMGSTRAYIREHYRLAVNYPAMFSDRSAIGEGTVTNLSVFGCTLECPRGLPENPNLHIHLILPDECASLPIEQAEVRWMKGSQVGLQFHQLERKANLRLHGFVWDRMLERLRLIKHQPTS